MKDRGDTIICRCEPSPQSNITISAPARTTVHAGDLRLDGMLAPVPRKSTSNIIRPFDQ